MTPEGNQAAVREFFARFTASDIEGALATLTDDATWWMPGKKDRSPTAGLYSKERIGRLFHRMVGALENGLEMTFKSCIAEGRFVAVEVESKVDLKNGRLYRQEYTCSSSSATDASLRSASTSTRNTPTTSGWFPSASKRLHPEP